MLSNRFTRVALVGGAIAIAACAKDNKTTSDSAAGAMNSTDTAASMNDSSAMNGGNVAAPKMTDANIVAFLDQANVNDSAGGKVASTKGTNKDVQAFGKMMLGDHHGLRVAGQDFAKKASITPAPASNDTSKAHGEHELAEPALARLVEVVEFPGDAPVDLGVDALLVVVERQVGLVGQAGDD